MDLRHKFLLSCTELSASVTSCVLPAFLILLYTRRYVSPVPLSAIFYSATAHLLLATDDYLRKQIEARDIHKAIWWLGAILLGVE